MPLSFTRPGGRRIALAMLLGLGVAVGCSGSGDSGTSIAAGGGAGSAGAPGTGQAPDSLAFEPSSTLTLVPGESRQLLVRASPPGVYDVKLALLGAFADASLDAGETLTAPDGTAQFSLVAPTSATTFSIRASVGSAVNTSVVVSVSAGGFATVQVTPAYSGKRPISFWVASVHAGTSCASLPGTPPPDGDLVAHMPAGNVGQIPYVPVGPVLAVTLRAGHFAGGCVDVKDGVSGEVNPITVPVIDRPIQLGGTDLDVALGLDADGWQASLSGGITPVAQAMLGGASNDIVAILDAMRDATPDPTSAQAFETARVTGAWDDVLANALGASTPPSMLRAAVKKWIGAGIAGLAAPDTFQAHLLATGQSPGSAELDLMHVGGVDPADAGFPVQNLVSFNADADDTVALGANLSWLPSRLLTALAAKAALAEHPSAASVPDALADTAQCDAVASVLTAQNQTEVFPGCDSTCVDALCHAAVKAMWDRARDASGTDWSTATLDISATGAAQVDDVAAPLSFSGTWVGKLTVSQAQLSVGGPAIGNAKTPK